MTDMTDVMRKDRLIEVLMSYAFTEEEKTKVIDMVGTAEVKDYVLALADGLRYGNWPWTTYARKTREVKICNCALENPDATNESWKDCPKHRHEIFNSKGKV